MLARDPRVVAQHAERRADAGAAEHAGGADAAPEARDLGALGQHLDAARARAPARPTSNSVVLVPMSMVANACAAAAHAPPQCRVGAGPQLGDDAGAAPDLDLVVRLGVADEEPPRDDT